MHCQICNKPEEEGPLFEGIFENKVARVCKECAAKEGIPIIRKPTSDQLASADKRYSVRERMERMSHPAFNPSDISKDQIIAHRNLNKLRTLPKKQSNDKLYDNYYWRVTLARRRKKISINQLAKQTGLSEEMIDSIEKGVLPANFEDPINKIEIALNVSLLKNHDTHISFLRDTKNKEKQILREVGEKIGIKPRFHKEEEYMEEIDIDDLTEEEPEAKAAKNEKLSKLSHGELDLSRRDNLQDITLTDLQRMKKEKERKQKELQEKKQQEEMFGDDVDFEDLDKI